MPSATSSWKIDFHVAPFGGRRPYEVRDRQSPGFRALGRSCKIRGKARMKI